MSGGDGGRAGQARRPKLRGYVDVRQLLALHEAIARGSIAQAAAALHVTSSAVSQQIAGLELAAGKQLLVRSPRGVRPTAAGAQLARHAEAILSELEQVDAALADDANARITIASFATATRCIIAPTLRAMHAAGEPLDVFVRELDPRDGLLALASGEVDAAIVYGHDLANQPVTVGCELHHLIDDQMLLALPADRFAEVPISIIALAGEPWLLAPTGSSCHTTAVRACHAAGFDPIVASESQDWSAILAMVAAGLGVALVPRLAIDPHSEDGVVTVETLDANVVRRVHVAHRRGAGTNPAVARLVEVLERQAESMSLGFARVLSAQGS